MKKNYIQPTLNIVHVRPAQMMALSNVGINRVESDADGSEALVKGNSSSDYNVWDDDWSK
ncbi:MAG: hypothetical protein IK144_03080 [Bacteroidaceae bacterium]|nr:hypothetical protein [Bacteroidaceae bacterium]